MLPVATLCNNYYLLPCPPLCNHLLHPKTHFHPLHHHRTFALISLYPQLEGIRSLHLLDCLTLNFPATILRYSAHNYALSTSTLHAVGRRIPALPALSPTSSSRTASIPSSVPPETPLSSYLASSSSLPSSSTSSTKNVSRRWYCDDFDTDFFILSHVPDGCV